MDLKKLTAYFEQIAKEHKEIKHSSENKRFVRLNIFELENTIRTTAQFPMIVMEKPYIPSEGKWANPRDIWRGGIMVIDKSTDKANFTKLLNTEDRCLEICRDIAARMINDRKIYGYSKDSTAWLQGLRLEAMNIELMTKPMHDMLYGARLNYEFMIDSKPFDENVWDGPDEYHDA